MHTTYQQIDELHTAYLVLPFKGDAILSASENITKLKPHLDTILMVKSKLIKQHNKGAESISSSDKGWAKFNEEYSRALSKEVDTGELIKLKKIDIDLTSPPVNNNGQKINLQGPISVLLSKGLLE